MAVHIHYGAKFIQTRTFEPAGPIDWREFTDFPKLPIELRLIIWAFALPDPRIVIIKGIHTREKDYRVSCQERIPSTLLINQESRKVALERYSLRFASFENVYGPPTYFDFSRDIINLQQCPPTWCQDFNGEFIKDLGFVQRIIMDQIYWSILDLPHLVKPFTNVCSLGIRRPQLDLHRIVPPLELQVLSSLWDVLGNNQDPKKRADRLKRLEVYSLSTWASFRLEQGDICWEP